MARIISRAAVRLEAESDGLARRLNRLVRDAARDINEKVTIDVDTRKVERGLRRIDRLAVGILSSLFSGKLISGAARAIRDYGAAIAAVTPALAAFVVESATALQSLALLPALGAAAAGTIATLVIGFQGLGDALKNMDDLEKFNEALEDLAPNARAFARTLRGLREPFRQLRLDVQQQLFDGVAESVQTLADNAMPTLRSGLKGIASELSDGFNLWAEYAASAEGVKNLDTILGNTEKALDNLGPAGTDFAAALADIAAVGSTFLEPLTDSLKRASSQFRDFIAEAEKTGQLKQFIQEGLDALERLGQLVISVGRLLSTIFTGLAGDSGSMLVNMRQGVDALNDFLESAKGQDILNSLGETMRTVGNAIRRVFKTALEELGPVLVELAPFLQELVTVIADFLVEAIRAVAPLLKGLATFLSENKEVLAPLVAGFLLVAKAGKVLAPVFRGLGKVIGFVARHWRTIIKVFKINPWVALITTVITVTIAIIQNWDKVKAFLIRTWNTIKNVATTVWTNIKNFFLDGLRAIRDFFVRIWNRITSSVRRGWNNISNLFSRGVESIKNAVSNGVNNVLQFFRELPGNVLAAVSGFGSLLYNVGADLLRGLLDGIGSMVSAAINKVKEVGGAILNGMKSFLGIASPSKEMARIGRFAGEGLIEGLTKIIPQVDRAAAQLGDSVTQSAQSRIRLTGPNGVLNGSVRGDDGGSTLVQNNYMQPGTDVRQFANTVLQRGQTATLSGGGTRAVSRQGVQAGVNDQRLEGVRM